MILNLIVNYLLIILNYDRGGYLNNGIMITFRVFLALFFLFIFTKLLSKRSLAKLTYFDYMAIVTLGTLAGNLAFNTKIAIMDFLLAMVLITIIIKLASYGAIKSKFWRKKIAGEATVLIENGKIREEKMHQLNYSYDYLLEQLRQEQIFNLSKIEFALLEPNGELSVQLKSQYRPVTPRDLGLETNYEGLSTTLILEGQVLKSNLAANNLSEEWLSKELDKRNIADSKKVTFAALGTNGKLYVDLYDDQAWEKE